ncbi:outer membrane porin GjpA [Mycolicibacillus parakoreensis]|uniref:outer membrane porin GjpA n=1 Tax=Mycolicibacillus parakoreensis TaxID=1069221 RepID=UPI0027E33A55|nr:outer membrane porin GjpA [Mycolicibacillus parakoreensis]MCV7314158.1 outer membrane porin GjpA [Mycolicibacillus parakoreensis]
MELTAVSDIDLIGPWADMLDTASINLTDVSQFFFEAPAAALQQTLVNQVGYLGDVLNGNIGDVFTDVGGNLQNAFQVATFLGDGVLDPENYTELVGQAAQQSLGPIQLLALLVMNGWDLGLPMDFPEVPAEILPLLNFAASPLSGVMIGAAGPVLSPFVQIANSVSDIVGDLTGVGGPMAALQGLIEMPAEVVGSFFNGTTLHLDPLLPLIAGVLPEGMEFNSLGVELGGLFTAGFTDNGNGVGGSILNALNLDLSASPLPIEGHAVGPIAALSSFSQILASALGWDGVGNPLTDLTFPTLGTELFSGLGGGDFGLSGLTDGFQELAAGLFDGFELGAFTDVFGNLGDLPGLFLEIPQLIIDALLNSF